MVSSKPFSESEIQLYHQTEMCSLHNTLNVPVLYIIISLIFLTEHDDQLYAIRINTDYTERRNRYDCIDICRKRNELDISSRRYATIPVNFQRYPVQRVHIAEIHSSTGKMFMVTLGHLPH